jgi:monofunctional biosynthetic peptidoglycan transglycosylase
MLRRVRRLVVALVLLAGIALLAAGIVLRVYGSRIEQAVAARIASEASRRGLVAHAGSVHVALFPPLRVDDLVIEKAGLGQARVASVDVTPRLWGRGGPGLIARCAVGQTSVSLPGGFGVEAGPSVWDVRGLRGFSADLREPTEGLRLESSRSTEAQSFALHAVSFQPSLLARIVQEGAPVIDPGLIDGDIRVDQRPPDEIGLDVRLSGRGLKAMAEAAPAGGLEAASSARVARPTDAELQLAASLHPREGTADLPSWRLVTGGAEVSGRAAVSGGMKDPRVDLSVNVERLDFARLFEASGQKLLGGADDLGSMALAFRVEGRVAEPASLAVTQRLDFTPPRKPPDALVKLRGDFLHEVELPDGSRRTIEVSPSSPDYVGRDAVPPLFVRSLLLGEDTGFYGHRGVDFAEVVAAVASSWSRGTPMRGASTLTQQLAKNLFLTRERSLRRKLQELALALLLESTLGKERILEIYLNVIEWGPDLYGLRPAARHYFGKEPAELTPREMAFLVALIPGPIKYQRSFAQGALTPGFEPLVTNLLAKLHSVGELTDEEYEAALAETLAFRSEDAPQEAPSVDAPDAGRH